MKLENFDLIEKRKIFLVIAGIMVFASLVAVLVLGITPGIDLKGGTQWHISMATEVNPVEIELFFVTKIGIPASVQRIGEEREKIIRLPEITEEERQSYEEALSAEFGKIEEKSFTSIGPVVGRELREKSLWAAMGILLGIFLFIAWAFRKASKPINSWKYGATALITLVHDVGITIGFFAVLSHFYGLQVDTTIIVALLVVLGFSVNDTIVVFDRVRENLILYKDTNMSLEKIFNKSVRQTVMRSINTSFTLVIVLSALIFAGPPTLFYFMLTILAGTLVGTYSSIFVASPILYVWGKR